MEKEFIPYEQALKLKELGFDKECLKRYYEKELVGNGGYFPNSIKAPLYQQAFRWFREKYRLDGHVTFKESPTNKIEGINSVYYDIEIYTLISGDPCKTYKFKEISDKKEKAEL